ncbi:MULTISPECIES: hypothetical protein [unclassified Rathayibacter]|uniref:hypothetical protein n=1 Tax=unclassified Rathayibacter TaxID=2609250 RepID=UPI0006F449E6|nr:MULTISPECIES: hypothetical protein [unclassified Rathayibacter]KQQ03683.1 hypothetical protein ASF42_09340 [Rathayibacter sp. Leaf294]KQS12139.1 hypothetical protein ASG06_09340 [Rathayibacter sp. Leaf185]
MTQTPPPPWGAPGTPTGPRVPLPPRTRFEPTTLVTTPLHARRLRSALDSRLRQASPERQRRLAELAEIGEGVVVLRTREFDRALERLGAPASAATSRGAVVVTLGGGGPALAAERADSLAIAAWSDVSGVEVGTVAHGAHRVRAAVLSVLAPLPPVAEGFRGLARASRAARRRRTVLVPLVVASPGPLGWVVADDRAFLFALDRLRTAHEGAAR